MNLLARLFLSSALLLPLSGVAQIARDDAAISIGYQYANFGSSFPAAEIDLMVKNASMSEGSKHFSNARHGMGALVRLTMPFNNADGGFSLDFTLGNKRVSDEAQYDSYNSDSSVVTPTTVSTKLRFRYLSMGTTFAWKRLSLGASMDMGMFASLIRYRYEGGADAKWQPWFTSPKIFGGGYTGKSPVIGATFSAGFLLTGFLELRVFRQITLFGTGATLSDRYFSIGNWGAELSFRISK